VVRCSALAEDGLQRVERKVAVCCLSGRALAEEERDWQAQSLAGVKTPLARRFDAISDQMSKVFATLHASMFTIHVYSPS